MQIQWMFNKAASSNWTGNNLSIRGKMILDELKWLVLVWRLSN